MTPNLLTQRAQILIIWFNNLPVTIAARIDPEARETLGFLFRIQV